MRTLIAAALLPLALAACASSVGARPNSDATELDRLRQACEARGGILTPSGRFTAQPAIDNPCVIRGGTNLPSSN